MPEVPPRSTPPPTPGAPLVATSPSEDLTVGSSGWRSVILQQVRHLDDEVEALPVQTNSAPVDVLDHVRSRIVAARSLAGNPEGGWVQARNWWTGSTIETAWDHLLTAREQLGLIEPTDQLRPQLTELARELAAGSADPAHDPQVIQIRTLRYGHAEFSRADRELIRSTRQHVRATNNDRGNVRGFRNNLVLATLLITIAVITAGAVQEGGFAHLLVGALGGLLTTALAWRGLTHIDGPYSINTAQAMLKIPVGAGAALLGVWLLRSGVIAGVSVTDTAASGWAVVFGMSQQVLTQAVDGAASKLGK